LFDDADLLLATTTQLRKSRQRVNVSSIIPAKGDALVIEHHTQKTDIGPELKRAVLLREITGSRRRKARNDVEGCDKPR
jgi:hypothetical protein